MPRIRSHKIAASCLKVALSCGSVACATNAPAAALDHATFNYLTHCGGCHGIEGRSGQTYIPVLRDQVGVFLCSPEGRAYIGRVPGVSMSLIRDDQQLADVLNFVIFKLGGHSTPAGTKAYTAAEIHALRASPVATTDMLAYRADVLGRTLPQCAR